MENLWGFNKLDIKRGTEGSPHGILKEQLEYFEKNTSEVLRGRMKNITVNYPDCEYRLSTSFEIVAPGLDSYSYTLFTMYCKPESDFPVLIFYRQARNFLELEGNEDFLCNNEGEFIAALKEVMGSEDTTRIVQTLYSKCNL